MFVERVPSILSLFRIYLVEKSKKILSLQSLQPVSGFYVESI